MTNMVSREELDLKIFLAKLTGRWYVVVAATLGLLAFPKDIAEGLGYRWPWPQIPKWAFIVILLGAVVYSAFDLWREAIVAARNAARVTALAEGDLRFDIDEANTCTYPYRDKRGRHVVIYGMARSSGPAAVRVTTMRLSDHEGRE
jgi:hypothetical protein